MAEHTYPLGRWNGPDAKGVQSLAVWTQDPGIEGPAGHYYFYEWHPKASSALLTHLKRAAKPGGRSTYVHIDSVPVPDPATVRTTLREAAVARFGIVDWIGLDAYGQPTGIEKG